MLKKLMVYTAMLVGGGIIGAGLTVYNVSTNEQSDSNKLLTLEPLATPNDGWSLWSDVKPESTAQQPQGTIEPLDIDAAVNNIVAQKSQFLQFAAAYKVALRASQQQLSQIIDTLMAMESNAASIGIARIFYVRFINLNPTDAADHFWRTVPEESTQHRRVMFNIYHEWAWLDMDKALADIVSNVPEKNRESLISFLLGDDHFTSNSALLALAQNYSERTRAAALLALAQRESHEQAFERILAMPQNSDARRHGLFRLVRRWASEDPVTALQYIKQMTNSGDRQNLISTVISVWAETDAEQALLAAIGIGKGNNYAYSALSVLAKTDGVQALDLIHQYQDKLDSTIKNQIMQTWASSDPRAAANYVELKASGQLRQDARQIAWHYTLQYPEEAYQWAERVGLLNDNNIASNMGNALVQADLAKAEALFADLPPSASRDGLFTNIVRQRSKVDIAQTHKWLAQYKDEAKYSEAQNNLLYEWTRQDPQASADVVLAMDDNPNRSGHLSSVASHWYDKSPDSALRWVFDLPESDMRDRAIASLAQKVGRADIDQATYIANQISNEQIQKRLLEHLKQQGR